MKKTYIAPELEVLKIQTTGILAASGDTFTPDVKNEELGEGNWADGRGGSLDDEY